MRARGDSPPRPKPRAGRSGQAMVEAIIVLFFVCLVFFAVYEYASLLTAHTVLDYAAASAARSMAQRTTPPPSTPSKAPPKSKAMHRSTCGGQVGLRPLSD